MKLTGTFLDEISVDIPHQNWGRREWARDFAAMRAAGFRRVFLIRCAWERIMAFPSRTIAATGAFHTPPVDLMDLFLGLAEDHGLEFYAGTFHSQPKNCSRYTAEDFREELAVNRALVREIQDRYGARPAFAGWYLSHELCTHNHGAVDLLAGLGAEAKAVSGGKPVMISPYFAGVKAGEATGDAGQRHDLAAARNCWDAVFSGVSGQVDYVAFQDGHVDYAELAQYLRMARELGERHGLAVWSNIESFDRDMPIRFLPIKWEKMLWKMEAAEAAGIDEGITFEFSHFMSPNSMYPSAAHLYDRYREYLAARGEAVPPAPEARPRRNAGKERARPLHRFSERVGS